MDHVVRLTFGRIGSNYVVRILSTLDRELLKPSSSVALHRHSNALVDILPPEADSSISMLGTDEKPDVRYEDVGGLDAQKQEIREAVELPLTQVCGEVIGSMSMS
jgi:26S proteasome regulatory subunit T3